MDKSWACAAPVRIATDLRAIRPGGWMPPVRIRIRYYSIRTVAIPGSPRANRHFDQIKKKNLFKSTCQTGSFTWPGRSGSGKRRALHPHQAREKHDNQSALSELSMGWALPRPADEPPNVTSRHQQPTGIRTCVDSILRVASQRSNRLGQRVWPIGERTTSSRPAGLSHFKQFSWHSEGGSSIGAGPCPALYSLSRQMSYHMTWYSGMPNRRAGLLIYF